MTTIDRLVQAVCPEFPVSKSYRVTYDRERFYKIINGTMYVPSPDILTSNLMEIDRFAEAIKAYAVLDSFTTPEDWEDKNLNLIWDEGNESEALYILKTLLREVKGVVASDIETKDVTWDNNELLSVGFCWADTEAAGITALTPEVLWYLQQLYNKLDVEWLWHNGIFDTTRLKYISNIDARIDRDTILRHFTGINEKKGTHSLKDLGQLYLQAPAWEDNLDKYKREYCREFKIKVGEFTYDMIPIQILIPYMLRDTIATFRLDPIFNRLARPESNWIYGKLIEAANTYKEIELTGCELNREHLEYLKVELAKQRDEAIEKMNEIVRIYWRPDVYSKQTGANIPKKGLEFNPGSPKQLKWMLERVTGKTILSTDKAALEELDENTDDIENEEGKQFVKAIGQMRKANKYMDTYALGFEALACKDNRIRGSFNLYGTETGRLSSSEPNMHNIPRNALIKNLIKAKPGYKLVQLDYSQAELRVLTALSGDPFMLKIYQEGRDLHDTMAAQMYGPNFTKEQRVITKSLNFGIAYGRGPKSIAQMFKISLAQARQTIDDWYRPVPFVKRFIQKKRNEPANGQESTTFFGRMRHFVITDETQYHVQNEAINFPIQSIASDLTLLSVIEINKRLKEKSWDAKIINTVHDSIILEVKDDEELIARVVEEGKKVMEEIPAYYMWGEGLEMLKSITHSTTVPAIEVPFRADAEVGYIWGELEKWKNE
jgi:DNA polymerase I-like protein with 3'-5' exonuclease and polymerase domains